MTNDEQIRQAQRRNIGRMSPERLERELVFARAFAPGVSPAEVSWLEELERELERRRVPA